MSDEELLALRDKFAIAALPEVMRIPNSEWPCDFSGEIKDECGNDSMGYSDRIAMAAYSIADSMLIARKNTMFIHVATDGTKLKQE